MSAYQAKPSVSSKKFSSKDAAATTEGAGRRQDLKISFATSEDLGHSKTWRMKTTNNDDDGGNPNSEEQSDDDDYENEPIVSHSIQHVWLEHPIPDKLFFLATGEGCGTAQVCITMQINIISSVRSIRATAIDPFTLFVIGPNGLRDVHGAKCRFHL